MKKTLLIVLILVSITSTAQVVSSVNTSAIRAWLGLGGAATLNNTDFLQPSNNLSDLLNAAAAKANLGLGNVNNTSDASKPISTATQTALDLKQDISTNNGGWTSKRVATTDFTTTSTTLTAVTELVSGTLSTATLYEFEAVLYVNSSSTAGIAVGINQTGTGTGSIGVFSGTATNAAATGLAIGSNALNTASAACVLVNGDGTISIRGYIKTSSSGSPTILVSVAKSASGTAKVYIGSVLRYRIAQ